MSNPLPTSPTPEHPPRPNRPRGWFGSALSTIALLVLAALAVWVLRPTLSNLMDRTSGSHRAIGQKLPALELQPLTGAEQPVTLDDLQGRVTLVAFWGTWCGPCKRELPHLIEVAHAFAKTPEFQFLAVSCGPGGPEDLEELGVETEVFLERAKLKVPTYADPKMVTRDAFDAVGRFQGYPTTFLLDRQGVIRQVWVGYDPEIKAKLTTLIPAMLEQK